ncbi:hypothetical protein SG34_027990 [Thalassomonas viridans]|uniref:Orphan protein n=1 Tax=Thalassomonas viridans TaxID=137584 RepID=A0AAE9Z1I5_9GAMM|nr:DUF6702 family protein [Thalassomonas viridans]WDE05096.1 hypothetical protein SG34_027990 [Thalassomonas viridans]
MLKRFLYLVPLLLITMANTALAHQQKAAETTVLFNKRSGQLEVAHRFYLHDTEHAVQSLFDKKADILNSADTQQKFADYVAQQFYLRTLADEKLPLTKVGHEVEGKFFWVYQDTKLPAETKGLKLYNGSLRELWPTQINMVNIQGQGKVRTLYFSDDKEWLIASFN